jgi:hypothetical protein
MYSTDRLLDALRRADGNSSRVARVRRLSDSLDAVGGYAVRRYRRPVLVRRRRLQLRGRLRLRLW